MNLINVSDFEVVKRLVVFYITSLGFYNVMSKVLNKVKTDFSFTIELGGDEPSHITTAVNFTLKAYYFEFSNNTPFIIKMGRAPPAYLLLTFVNNELFLNYAIKKCNLNELIDDDDVRRFLEMYRNIFEKIENVDEKFVNQLTIVEKMLNDADIRLRKRGSFSTNTLYIDINLSKSIKLSGYLRTYAQDGEILSLASVKAEVLQLEEGIKLNVKPLYSIIYDVYKGNEHKLLIYVVKMCEISDIVILNEITKDLLKTVYTLGTLHEFI